MRNGKDAFQPREWLAADADGRKVTDASLTDGVSCDAAGCVVQAGDGSVVALTLKPEAFADDCACSGDRDAASALADCAAMVLDQEMLRTRGTLALHKTADGYAVLTTGHAA
jgi:competence protein ComEC